MLQSWIGTFASSLASFPATVISAIFDIILVVVLSIYWVIAMPSIRQFTLSLIAPAHRREADDVLSQSERTMGGFVRGTLIDAVIVGILTYLGLLLIGVRFPLVLGLLAAVGEVLPTIGPILAAIPAIAVALLDSPTQALIVLAFYVVLQQLETHLLLPNIMRREADVPPVLAIVGLMVGYAVAGILGAIIAIPVAGTLRVFVLCVIAPTVRRWAGAPQAAG